MKVSGFCHMLLSLMILVATCAMYTKAGNGKEGFGENIYATGSYLVYSVSDLVSLIEGNSNHEEILTKFEAIEESVDHVAEHGSLTDSLLQTLLQELSKLVYGNAIADAEREIDHCYEALKDLSSNPESTQSINNVKNCYSYISQVKQIGKIAGGQTIGISPTNLFEIYIQQQGYCNGSELVGLHSYLAQLLMKGCSSVISAELLEYGNSSAIYKDDCMKMFEETDKYLLRLFKSCASESCNIVQQNIANVLHYARSADQAFSRLTAEFPWFYFLVIETVSCTDNCLHDRFERFGNLRFNIQTYWGAGRMFVISYLDERYVQNGTGLPSGFNMPQLCRRKIQNNLGVGINDVQGSSFITVFMYLNTSVILHTPICESHSIECMKPTEKPPTTSSILKPIGQGNLFTPCPWLYLFSNVVLVAYIM